MKNEIILFVYLIQKTSLNVKTIFPRSNENAKLKIRWYGVGSRCLANSDNDNVLLHGGGYEHYITVSSVVNQLIILNSVEMDEDEVKILKDCFCTKIKSCDLKEVKCLGHGTCGHVYLCTLKNEDTKFCVKECGIPDIDERGMYERKVHIMTSLKSCDHAVRIYDYFFSDTFCYIAMEYCSGGILETKVAEAFENGMQKTDEYFYKLFIPLVLTLHMI